MTTPHSSSRATRRSQVPWRMRPAQASANGTGASPRPMVLHAAATPKYRAVAAMESLPNRGWLRGVPPCRKSPSRTVTDLILRAQGLLLVMHWRTNSFPKAAVKSQRNNEGGRPTTLEEDPAARTVRGKAAKHSRMCSVMRNNNKMWH